MSINKKEKENVNARIMAQVIAAIIEPAGRCFNIWAVKAYLVSKLGSIVAFKTDARAPRKTFLLNDRWECPEVGGIARARPTWITNSFVRPLKKVRPCRHRKNVKAKKKKERRNPHRPIPCASFSSTFSYFSIKHPSWKSRISCFNNRFD